MVAMGAMSVALAPAYHGVFGYHGASGYHGPPELTLPRALTEWTLDPWALGFVLLLGGLYLSGVRRVRRSGTAWPRARTVAFCGLGLGFCVIAAMSWVGVYQPVLFYARSVQTILLLLVVPLFLALGRPLTLLTTSLPGLGPRIEAGIRSRAARVVTFPAVTTMVLVIVPFAVYFTPWYAAGFHSVAVRELTCLALMAPGFVFFWTLLRVDPVPKAYPYLVSLWVTGAEVIGDAVLGLAVIADQSLIAGAYYHALGRPWGPSLATDQVLGGGTLWILGDIVGLPFLAAQLIQMIREDEAEAVVIDAELDARNAARGPAGDVGEAGASVPGDRPWWESDPRFAGRFQPVDDGRGACPPGDEPPSAPSGEREGRGAARAEERGTSDGGRRQ
jgi:cytochrome c oxidase assembly factor CtaG